MPWINGLFQGTRMSIWPKSRTDDLEEILDNAVKAGQQSAIVNLVMVPSSLFDTYADTPLWDDLTFTRPTSFDRRDGTGGYVPRNKKLLTSPYMFLRVDGCTQRKDYDYEKMDVAPGGQFTWRFIGVSSPNPEVIALPVTYDNRNMPGEYALVMKDFPQCAFATDTYRAWLAYKTSGGFLEDSINFGAGVVGNLMSGNIGGAAMSAVGSWSAQRKEAYNASRQSHLQGEQGGSALVATRRYELVFKVITMTKQFAKSADDFLDRYGYTTERLKVPNRDVRPHWCYTKTSNCAVKGIIPAYYAKQIEDIYNKGITFWKNISEVGDYSLDNTV